MEIYPLQTFLTVSHPQQQIANYNQASNSSIQPISIDPSSVWLMPWSPDNSVQANKLELYNKKGIKEILYVKNVSDQPDYYSVLEKGLDPADQQQGASRNPLTVPPGGETMAEQADQIKQASQGGNLSTPIAGSMNISLHAPTSPLSTWSLNNDNPDFLAEAVVSYNKAQTQIAQTYSDQAIAQRAASSGITDIAAYQKNQYQIRDTELSASEQNFEQKVESGIKTYVGDLYRFFDPSQTSNERISSEGFSENPVYQQSQDDMADLTVELNKLYGQYEKTHSVDYSKDSVATIAAQFNASILGQVKTTVSISGTDFTYKDLYVSHSALQAIGNNDLSLSDPFSAALGQSGINYLAQNEMTSGAATMLKQGYATSFNKAITQLNDIVYGKDQPSSPDKAFQMLGNLDTSSATAFSSRFNRALSQLQNEYSSLDGGKSGQIGINHSNDAQSEPSKVQDLYSALQNIFSEAG